MEFCMSHVLFRLRQYFKHFSSGKQREMGFIKRFSHANYYVSCIITLGRGLLCIFVQNHCTVHSLVCSLTGIHLCRKRSLAEPNFYSTRLVVDFSLSQFIRVM
jgi:hypothetical protein